MIFSLVEIFDVRFNLYAEQLIFFDIKICLLSRQPLLRRNVSPIALCLVEDVATFNAQLLKSLLLLVLYTDQGSKVLISIYANKILQPIFESQFKLWK